MSPWFDTFKTGFKFMANKQFRIEKKLGTSVCADISHYTLKKNNTFNFYRKKSLNIFFWMKILVFWRFLDQIQPKKTGFWTNIEKMFFFSIQYLNILQFIKTVVDNMCVLFDKNSRNGCKRIFDECDKKIIKHFSKKKF